jgi:hypothetical protein
MTVEETIKRLRNIYEVRKRKGVQLPDCFPKDFDALLIVINFLEAYKSIRDTLKFI